MSEKIDLSKIKTDGGTQSRAQMDETTIAEYTAAWAEFAEFPPITVFYDGEHYWLADGYHRYHSRLRHARSIGLDAGNTYIEADVRQGTQRDAILFSVGANATHGLRRTSADKRRAVETLLRDPEWASWSDREIGRRCGVDGKTVAVVRSALSAEIPQTDERVFVRNGKTHTMKQPERHWATMGSNERHFMEMLTRYGYTLETVLERIQPGATALTDLTTDKTDTWNKFAELALADAREQFPAGSIVKHTTSRHFGKIISWGYPRNATVLNMAWGSQQSWTYESCIMSSFDEWQEWSDQHSRITIASPFSGLQDVVTPVDTPIWSPNESGLLSQTMRTITAGKSMRFVRAFRQNGNEFGECSWAGSPTYVLLSALTALDKHGEYQAPLPDPEPAAQADEPLPDLPQRQVEFLQALAAGQPVNRNAATRFALRGHGLITDSDDWAAIELTDLGRAYLAATTPAQADDLPQVGAPITEPPTTTGQNNSEMSVTFQRDDDCLIVTTNDWQCGYSSEHVLELLPALLLVLDYSEGDDIPADGNLLAAARQLLQFADGVLEMIEGEIYQTEQEQS